MQWDADAEALLRQTSADDRSAVRSNVERLAAAKGSSSVSVIEFAEARYALGIGRNGGSASFADEVSMTSPDCGELHAECIQNADELLGTCSVTRSECTVVMTCAAPLGCTNQVTDPDDLGTRLVEVVEGSGYRRFMEEHAGLEKFKIALSGCPNGCSQPQIQDFGVLGRAIPEITQIPCNECLECVSACSENAIQIIDADPETDYIACAACGDCARACPSGTIIASRRGYCIKLGGRLGRHPQLGPTIIPLASDDEVVAALSACLDLYMQSAEGTESFCDVVNRLGLDAFGQAIGDVMRCLNK